MKPTIVVKATSFCNFQRNITKARAAFPHNFCIFPRTRTSSLCCLNLALKCAVTSTTQSHKWHKTIWGVFQMLHIPTSLIYWGKLQKGGQIHLWSFLAICVSTSDEFEPRWLKHFQLGSAQLVTFSLQLENFISARKLQNCRFFVTWIFFFLVSFAFLEDFL